VPPRWLRHAGGFVFALALALAGPNLLVFANGETTAPQSASELTADEIYERYSERNARKTKQKLRIVSRDPGGSEQLSRFTLRLKDERGEDGKPIDRVRSRMLIDVEAPFDLRHTRYLIIDREPGPNEEFVYMPSARRVRRVDLTRTSFLGTDYTFGDFQVKTSDEVTHTRLPDEEIDGVPVYVVESKTREGVETDYSRVIAYVEKTHFVPLRTRSWDEFGVEVKEMTANPDSIRAFDDLWLAAESTMRDLLTRTTSTLYVDELDTEPRFKRGTFTAGRLSRGK